MSYSKHDLLLVNRIYGLAKEIEAHLYQDLPRDQNFEKNLSELRALLFECSFSENAELVHLQKLSDSLNPQIAAKNFDHFMIPIERILSRSQEDGDLLILRKDSVAAKALEKHDIVFVLHNLRSAFNVGSLFRLADALNIQELVLVGYTPDPNHKAVEKTALGSHQSVAWRKIEKLELAVEHLRSQNYYVTALETTNQATSIYQDQLPKKIAFLVGNERFGLEANHLSLCDQVRIIPHFGTKNSLNVAQALAVASYEWLRQNIK